MTTVGRLSEKYPRGSTFLEAFTRTLCVDAIAERYDPATDSDPRLDVSKTSIERIVATPTYSDDLDYWKDGDIDVRRLLTHARQNLIDKSFFETTDGCIGLTSRNAQIGDDIWVVLGCDSPITARLMKSAEYRLVSPCYLHGVMNSETFLGPEPDGFKLLKTWDDELRLWVVRSLEIQTGEKFKLDRRLINLGLKDLSDEEETIQGPGRRLDIDQTNLRTSGVRVQKITFR
jgi:hypothetical protein